MLALSGMVKVSESSLTCRDAITAFNKTNREVRQGEQLEAPREDAIVSLTNQTEQIDVREAHMTISRKWEDPNFFNRCNVVGYKKTARFSVFERS